MRRQLPVSSPVSAVTLLRGAAAALGARRDEDALEALLAQSYGAERVVLTDGGTSALVLALRLAVAPGGTVALPAWACIDLTAAVVRAGVRVRLYDLDPETLSPDLDSLRGALGRGADAVLVAHLFGYPADMRAVHELAAEHGAVVLEDAAQGAGGLLHDAPLGATAALAVLSFGRGKGTTGGRGGALLASGQHADQARQHVERLGRARRGWRELVTTAAAWVLGRPTTYGIPASIPALRLGEMVYHPAGEPAAMSVAAAAMARASLAQAPRELARRRANAERLRAALAFADALRFVHPIAGAWPGYLRLPVRIPSGARAEPRLGIAQPYPRTLMDHAELRASLHPEEREPAGARELARTLVTLPTHGQVSRRDVARIAAWARGLAPGAASYGAGPLARGEGATMARP